MSSQLSHSLRLRHTQEEVRSPVLKHTHTQRERRQQQEIRGDNKRSTKTKKSERKSREKMTIGKNSRKSSVRSSIRAPKFLDKSSGFYGRLDEPEVAGEGEEVRGIEVERWSGTEDSKRDGGVVNSTSVVQNSDADEKEEAADFNEGLMEDDGETLLQRKPSRRSSRWRRSSRRKQKEGKPEEDAARDEGPSLCTESPADALEDARVTIEIELEKVKKMEEAGRGMEPTLVHFTVREDEDDQVLIRDKKRGREEEGEEERRMKREQEEGMKVVKRNSVKTYRKALDRALRRGWEAFITNLYSVTLTPVTSSSLPSSKKKTQHGSVLAVFQ
ncbi:vicilin-like seed storage protein At2g18540 [Plectropomus leopardus]|uniref:vicilin-like seed storage protein At2g18540 n=1 Tax=Plectropomus leopardus TaxID=160734 RepID=UPI001C4D07BF|nr:vicilin-like seed storage protein At2g18540 [Plectropomus leopardus]